MLFPFTYLNDILKKGEVKLFVLALGHRTRETGFGRPAFKIFQSNEETKFDTHSAKQLKQLNFIRRKAETPPHMLTGAENPSPS